MQFEKEKKYLIVSEREYGSLVFLFKKKNPLFDIQWMHPEQVYDELGFVYQKDPIPYLLKKQKYDYSQCRKLLSILRIGDLSKQNEYCSLLEELDQNQFLKRDDLGILKFKNKMVLLLEEEENFELHEFLNRKGISWINLTLEDLGLKKKYDEVNPPKILEFDHKFLQYSYLFSDIRKRILEDEKVKDKITILVKDQQDIFYINYFSSLFKLESRMKLRIPFVANEEVAKAIHTIFKNKSFVLDESQDEAVSYLIKIIKTYDLAAIPSFDFAYSCLMEILATKTLSYAYHEKGLLFTNTFDFTFDENELIYVTNFQHDDFYKEYDDNNLLSDDQLEEIGVNPSYVKTKMDRRKKLNYVQYHSFVFLSRVLLHLKDKIYASQFLSEMKWTSRKQKGLNEDGVYTLDAKKMMNAYFKDINHDKPDNEYRNYHHQYQKIKHKISQSSYSFSRLDNYFKCPFYYYLESVLKLSNKDVGENDKLAIYRGNLIHAIFEDIYTRSYADFDKAYDEIFTLKYQEIKEDAEKSGYSFSPKEEVSFAFVYKWLKDLIKIVLTHKEHSNIVEEKAEEEITFTLKDNEDVYSFKGRIDKLVYTQGASKQRYYTIIDYKTGSSGSFDLKKCFLGGSLQLPIYYLALKEKENYELTHNGTDHFGGFGIQHTYFPSSIPVSKEHIYGKESIMNQICIAQGIIYLDEDYVLSFDNTFKADAMQKGGKYRKGKPSFSSNKDSSLLSDCKYTLDQFIEDVKCGAITSLRKIKENDFSISPTATKLGPHGDEPCQYCHYKDICYHAKADVRDISDEISKHFVLKKDISTTEEDE